MYIGHTKTILYLVAGACPFGLIPKNSSGNLARSRSGRLTQGNTID
jgi:hypothetical protein